MVASDSEDLKAEPIKSKQPVAEFDPQSDQNSDPFDIESLVGAIPPASLHPTCSDGTCQASGKSLETELFWADSPAKAYEQAATEDKLVFLIHVSGNFEIPGFT